MATGLQKKKIGTILQGLPFTFFLAIPGHHDQEGLRLGAVWHDGPPHGRRLCPFSGQ